MNIITRVHIYHLGSRLPNRHGPSRINFEQEMQSRVRVRMADVIPILAMNQVGR